MWGFPSHDALLRNPVRLRAGAPLDRQPGYFLLLTKLFFVHACRFAAMKKLILLTLALIINTASFAADTKPIEEVFQRYWSAYAKKDFVKAAADVLPSDLEDAKTALLPVFLQAQTSKE